MRNANYFQIVMADNDADGVAYAPDNVERAMLYERVVPKNWVTIQFELKDGRRTDYQANNLGWHLCSDRMKSILDEIADETVGICWLPVSLKEGLEVVRYHALHLTEVHDVLSKSRSLIIHGVAAKPVFNEAKVGARHVFACLENPSRVFVSEDVCKRLKAAQLTGLDFLAWSSTTDP
ncbi:MAG TPA: DUF1629 domain-containing protein [Candidatus Paceibacterota bacterium]|nr:DUF1629 domain-containing protein [Candidatus Paceibacterota bacterium]